MRTNRQVEVIVFRTLPEGIRFLLLKRNPRKGGFWQPVTGGVHEGEQDEDAARRELREELGIEEVLRLIDLQVEFEFTAGNRQLRERVFGAELAPAATIRLSPEHTDSRWGTRDEALAQYLK